MARKVEDEVATELTLLPPSLHETIFTLKLKTNQKVEYERSHKLVLKNTPLFQHELFRVEREAYDFLDLTVDEMEQQTPNEWPYLLASIGNDYSSKLKRYVETLIEAAELINEKAFEFELMMAQTRKERKDVLAKIEQARSREEATKAYVEYLPKYNERLRND